MTPRSTCTKCYDLELRFGAREGDDGTWEVRDAERELVATCPTRELGLLIAYALTHVSGSYGIDVWCEEHSPQLAKGFANPHATTFAIASGKWGRMCRIVLPPKVPT